MSDETYHDQVRNLITFRQAYEIVEDPADPRKSKKPHFVTGLYPQMSEADTSKNKAKLAEFILRSLPQAKAD